MKLLPLGVTIVATLMIIFGTAEIATGFRHRFLGISTSANLNATLAGAGIGALYLVAGLLVMTMKRRAVDLVLVCLAFVIVGRCIMVFTGVFPVNSPEQTFAIVAGTSIAILFAIYIGLNRKLFVR